MVEQQSVSGSGEDEKGQDRSQMESAIVFKMIPSRSLPNIFLTCAANSDPSASSAPLSFFSSSNSTH